MTVVSCACGSRVPLHIEGDTAKCCVCGARYNVRALRQHLNPTTVEPDPCACSGGRPQVIARDGLECHRCGVAMIGTGELRDTITRWNRMQLALCRGAYATLLLLADMEAL